MWLGKSMKFIKSKIQNFFRVNPAFLIIFFLSSIIFYTHNVFASGMGCWGYTGSASGYGIGYSSINWQWSEDSPVNPITLALVGTDNTGAAVNGLECKDIMFQVRASTGGGISGPLSPGTSFYRHQNLWLRIARRVLGEVLLILMVRLKIFLLTIVPGDFCPPVQ